MASVVPFGPEDKDVLDTDEDLNEHIEELEQIISSQQTNVYESQPNQGNESQQTQGNESQSNSLSRTLSETLSRQPSFKQNRQLSSGLQSKMTGQKSKRKTETETKDSLSKVYYILSHGQLALAKHEFKSHCKELVEINHITVPGSILLTHVHRDKNGIKFPLLHHLCNIESKSNWYDITEDFILGSSKATNEYDGVYLCINGVADRVIPFRDSTVKVRLSTVVNKICEYNKKFTVQIFKGQKFTEQPFKVKVLSCLKNINGTEKDAVCDQRGLPHEDCKYLGLSRQCSILLGGKTKKRRRKRSRKKSVHAHHRRR